MTRVFIWGAGRCGRTLANALHAAGHQVLGTWNRTQESANAVDSTPWPRFAGPDQPLAVESAEVVWVGVPDDQIGSAQLRLGDQVALHASGAVPADALRSTGATHVGACHPIQSFAEAMSSPDHVAGITFGIEGDALAVSMASSLVSSMGARHFVVTTAAQKALYHAACCVASNALVALADRAVSLFEAAGVERVAALKALAPLITGTAANLAQADEASHVLTGPVRRGDVEVVEQHLQVIAENAPDQLDTYRHILSEVLRIHPDASFDKLEK